MSDAGAHKYQPRRDVIEECGYSFGEVILRDLKAATCTRSRGVKA